MKKAILLLISIVLLNGHTFAQSFGGKVMGNDGESVPFAGIIMMSLPDSTVLAGTMADIDGNFTFDTYTKGIILVASSVGYTDAQITPKNSMNNTITLNLDSQMLEAAVFKVELPKTRLEAGALVTRVKNSVLENAGSAFDALAKVPGMMRQGDDLQVIGKGHPTYYINGRRVQDESELRRLLSSEIKEIEVINNPGSAYSSDAKAVVKIRTTQRVDEGIGGTVQLSDIQTLVNGNNILSSNVNLDYRHKGLDLMLGVSGKRDELNRYNFDMDQTTITDHEFNQNGYINSNGLTITESINLGANYQFNDNHSAGIRIEKGFNPEKHSRTIVDNIVSIDRNVIDDIKSDTYTRSEDKGPVLLNGYYNGKINGLSIDWNTDYYTSSAKDLSDINESDMSSSSVFNSRNSSDNSMIANKIVFGHNLGKGSVNFGSEVSFIRRDNDYTITIDRISNTSSKVKENNNALFIEYSRLFPKAGMLTAGLRYEYTDFDFDSSDGNDVSRNTSRFYPSISFGTEINGLQAQLSYNVKTRRPTYGELRSGIEYGSRFTLNSGNPTLKDEIIHGWTLSMNKKWFSFISDIQKRTNSIFDWTYPYDENGTVLIGMINFDRPLYVYDAYVVVSPTFGRFTTSNVFGFQKQDISFNLDDPRETTGKREVKFDKPMFIFNSNNYLRLDHDWQLELTSEFYSKAHFGNACLQNNYWDLGFAVQKSCLKDKSLTFRLSANDLFQTANFGVLIDLGNYQLLQNPINGSTRSAYEMHRITFSVKYSFNARKDRYHGKGAAREMIDRL